MDNSSTWNPVTDVYLGWDNAAGDLPVAGDWNGDGRSETGVYRSGVGFYLKMDNGSTWNPVTDIYLAWDNTAGDLPIGGDWNGDGRSETGVDRWSWLLSEDGQRKQLEFVDRSISGLEQREWRLTYCGDHHQQ